MNTKNEKRLISWIAAGAVITTMLLGIISFPLFADLKLSIVNMGVTMNGFNMVLVNYDKSELFTKDDMNFAIDHIKLHFGEQEGRKLIAVSYLGDEKSNKEKQWYIDSYATRNKRFKYDQVMMFNVIFKTAEHDYTLESNEIIEWSWTFARTADGEWEGINFGMG